MPLYEYICNNCGKKSELLVRTSDMEPVCDCGSKDMERIFSPFAVSEGSGNSPAGCSDGSCGLPSSPCASGMCGL